MVGLALERDNGEHNRNYYSILGVYIKDNGKEKGNG